MFDPLVLICWLSPFFYTSLLLSGKFANFLKRRKFQRRAKVDLLIFQVPTIGNVETVNEIIKRFKSYNLPVPTESWVVIEEGDNGNYIADRVVVVPKDFKCEDLYKARALEYARRLRVELLRRGEIPPNYLIIQADDDALPSEAFIRECLEIDADIVLGTICPRALGFFGTILDYERCVACATFCNFFTNIQKPIFGHGEGMCISSKVDQSISYDVSDVCGKKSKLISSEDLFYLHKVSLKGYAIFNSEKPVYITPPH